MNRRRGAKAHLSFGTILLLITAAVVMSAAGVFHAYVKNRQVNVAREIQRAEERISQHELDIRTKQMQLAEQLNRFLLRDRLREFNSDLRPIPVSEVREIEASAPERASLAAGSPGSSTLPASAAVAEVARRGP